MAVKQPKLSDKEKEEKQSKPKAPRRQLTDLMKSLYDSCGIVDINWGLEGKRIEMIKKGNPEINMTDEGIMECLRYIVQVKMIDIFDNNGGSILNLVPYYYIEASIYKEQEKFVDKLIKDCKALGYTSKIKDKSDLLSSLQRIMRKNNEQKIITIQYIVDYLKDIKGYSLFNEDRITILGAIEYNFDEAREFFLKCKQVEKSVEGYEFSDDVIVVTIADKKAKRIIEPIMTFD